MIIGCRMIIFSFVINLSHPVGGGCHTNENPSTFFSRLKTESQGGRCLSNDFSLIRSKCSRRQRVFQNDILTCSRVLESEKVFSLHNVIIKINIFSVNQFWETGAFFITSEMCQPLDRIQRATIT